MDLLVDYADLIYSNETQMALQRMVRPMHFDNDTLAYDNMEDVGPAGNFLDSDHTLDNYQDELWVPQYFERGNYEKWEKRGSKDIREVCLEEARRLIGELKDKEILSQDVRNEIDAIASASTEKAKNIKR